MLLLESNFLVIQIYLN